METKSKGKKEKEKENKNGWKEKKKEEIRKKIANENIEWKTFVHK